MFEARLDYTSLIQYNPQLQALCQSAYGLKSWPNPFMGGDTSMRGTKRHQNMLILPSITAKVLRQTHPISIQSP